MLLFDNMAVNMNGKNHCRTRWWIKAYTKLVFLFYYTKQFFENFRLFFIQFIYMYEAGMLGNVQNTAGVNYSRCCAIAEILWSRSHLPEINRRRLYYRSYLNTYKHRCKNKTTRAAMC